MQYKATLKKMLTEYGSPIQYYLETNSDYINVNQLLDKNISIEFDTYECLSCGLDKKIFRQGHCYDCYMQSANVGDWIMKPELSKAHLEIEDRDLAYEKQVQLQPHIVYLATSSNLKVGVTRKSQIPTRWIDQGASKAIAMLETPNRYLAGVAEVALKAYVSDKTSWQKMLKNEVNNFDLLGEMHRLNQFLPNETQDFFLSQNTDIYQFDYPVLQYPKKIKSLNLQKTPFIQGKLKGIKGQYLLFENGNVFNVRNNEGYVVHINIED
ncbi:MAG TPA: DUF2797 domain-containing protein [Flavobacteriia bacterium]|nr:DUF2797 domain-containing protein [Flavobacteriia bacterium]